MNYNEYRDEAFATAKRNGFHEEECSVEHLKCLIISEMMEAVEADRLAHYADLKRYFDAMWKMPFGYNFDQHIKDTVEDELADVCIRIFDLAGYKNIDLNDAMQKVTYNSCLSGTFTENIYRAVRVLSAREPLGVSLARTLTRILKIAEQDDIDIERHIQLKMDYNKGREYKHGKKY